MSLASMKDVAGYVSRDNLAALLAPLPREDVDLGHYTFLPYVRSGIAAGLTDPWDWTSSSRGGVEVTLPVVDATGASHPVPTQKLSVLGPGDVAGFDIAQVVRTHPTAGDRNASNDDLVAVDLDRPDLPWMFTPAGPKNGQLMPWLQLVVVPDTGTQLQPGRAGALDRLVTTSEQLHPLDAAWAYAHAQLIGPPAAGSLQQRLSDANAPLNCSRLLSPRRLEPQTAYVAAVVPTFLAGRQAGLGLEPGPTLERAWHDGEGEVTLPVYYSFSFATGERGDFEYLAHELVGVPAPYSVGYRWLDTSSPAPGLEEPDLEATGRVQVVAGPLVSPAKGPAAGELPRPDEASQAWSDSRTAELASRLGEGPPDDPRVAPPLYAGSHLARTTTDGAPDWFRDVNLVAKDRVVAGLGARVVQMDQEKLMAAAWQQVRGVDAANRALRLAQLARQLGASLHARHLSELDASALLGVTRAVHTRLLEAPERTLALTVRGSALPEAVASVAWRRFVRPAARLTRLPETDPASRQQMLASLVAGSGTVARDWRYDYVAPDAVTRVSDVALALVPDAVAATLPNGWADTLRTSLPAGPALPDLLAAPDLLSGVDLAAVSNQVARTIASQLLARSLAAAPAAGDERDPARLLVAASQAAVVTRLLSAAAQVTDVVVLPEEVAKRLALPLFQRHAGRPLPVKTSDLSAYVERIRQACEKAGLSAEFGAHADRSEQLGVALETAFDAGRFVEALGGIGRALVARGGLVDIERDPLQIAQHRLLAELHPAVTVTARVTGRLSGVTSALPSWLRPGWFTGGLVEPIMAAPHFHLPMALRLYAYDKEWLMPGAAALKPHQAVSLLETNNVFVEAFMLGLNTEMANELLWRGYPTDRRGTYFSSFWRRVDDLRSEIHRFGDGQLGDHVDPALGDKIVLFVRGDLVRRYPALVAHAMIQVDLDEHGVPSFEAPTAAAAIETLFQVPLAPDVLLVGFDLTPERVNGAENIWFTLSENPTEPRFGLDEPRPAADPDPPEPLPHAARNSLDWADPALSGGLFLLPDTWLPGRVDPALASYATDAARFAHIVFQLPSRAAYRGRDLIASVQAAAHD